MSVKIFYVQLFDGPPWGFRMKEEKGKPALVISRVNSKGRQQGLKEGDLVISVNGQSTLHMSHAEAQRIIRESTSAIELELERSSATFGANGFNVETNGNTASGQVLENRFNPLDEEAHHAGSWSTDSTSTGSTTIHVSSLTSDGGLSPTGNVWSPSTKKRANLHLNLTNNHNEVQPISVANASTVANQTTTSSTTSVIKSVKMSTSKKEVVHVQDDQDEKSPVWQPFGAPYDGPPQFRPVKLKVDRSKVTTATKAQNESHHINDTNSTDLPKPESPQPIPKPPTELPPPMEKKAPEVHPSPDEDAASLIHSSSTTFTKTGWSSHLPPSQSPTITLLQKAREGQIPKGAVYIEEKSESTPIPRNAVLIDQKVTVDGDTVHTDSYYAVPTLTTETTARDVKAPPKYDGIGPTEYGIPVGLRTGVKDEYGRDWYKTMYKSLHRNKFPNDTSKAVHLGGYMSEPEYERKDIQRTKYAADHRRMPEKTVTYTHQATSDHHAIDKSRLTAESTVARHEPRKEAYRVEPRSIADYEPGRSSLAEREFEKHEHLGPVSPRPQQGLNRRWANVLLSDGYESDSTLIRKTGRNPEVDPDQQKAWYKEIQKGGEIPLTGLRKTVPEKPTASPHQYQETQVNIHYKSPIRHLEKEFLDEDEFKRIQEEALRKLYEEERQKKHQQELAELEMRRHSDFFTPSQKSPIPLNRYENPFQTGSSVVKSTAISYSRSPPPKTMARTKYPFRSQSTRELSLNKGDIVYINRQVDNNWFEGEHHGLVGIFPASYVEIIPTERANLQPRKAIEGEALVKYNFPAQSPLELSLFKGERVILLRKLDHNWYEGRLGVKKGIFPVSYVHVLQEPQEHVGYRTISPKPPSPILSSSEPPLRAHEVVTYTTNVKPLQNKPPVQLSKSESKLLTQSLHIDTYNEPIPYRSLYSYKPQNDDELELRDGDTVYVMEKCDDGWYVGTSLRTGLFGTFPGNYVERI